MNRSDSLGDRMKSYYEKRYEINLPRRTNVVIRVDGKAFHTFTKGLKAPFDECFAEDMNQTAAYMCENIQGARLGYVQSDEISIIVSDYETLQTDAWFDNNLQKMCSISASLATAKFNKARGERFYTQKGGFMKPPPIAMFDSRVFIIPEKEEIVNYLIWRQQDCTRNSISMAAQSMYSAKQLHKKSGSEKQDMMIEKGVNWNNYPSRFKRGAAIIKVENTWAIKLVNNKPSGKPILLDGNKTINESEWRVFNRSNWVDVKTPIFTVDREFIRELL